MKTLTVIIRDDSPMIFCGDNSSYRSIKIGLTQEQISRIALRKIGTLEGKDIYEQISRCFIEDC